MHVHVAKEIIKIFFIHNNLLSSSKEKDKLKEIPKAGYRLALDMKLQKEVISNQKQPSCKKRVRPPKDSAPNSPELFLLKFSPNLCAI